VCITGGRSGDKVEFDGGASHWNLGVRISREEARKDCRHLGDFRSWWSLFLGGVTFRLLGPAQRQYWSSLGG